LLRAFAAAQPGRHVAVGLEMVDQPLQPVLDEFNRGALPVDELRHALQWDSRWGWRYSKYRPVFDAARALGAPLVALNVPPDAQRRVLGGGLGALTAEEREQYSPNVEGIWSVAQEPTFQAYADLTVLNEYEDALAAGVLGSRDPARATRENFLSVRMVRDEAMSVAACRYLKALPGNAGMLFLVGYKHVRFEYGVVHRLRRLCRGSKIVRSLLLNPSPEDTMADAEGEVLNAVLPYAGAPQRQLPELADYMWTEYYS